MVSVINNQAVEILGLKPTPHGYCSLWGILISLELSGKKIKKKKEKRCTIPM